MFDADTVLGRPLVPCDVPLLRWDLGNLILDMRTIILPHRSAIKMYHEPFGRIESDAIRILYSSQICLILWANESGPGICGINVKPHLLGFA